MAKTVYLYEQDLRKVAKNDFEQYIFKLMNTAVFGNNIENIRKHNDIKRFKTEKIRNYLVWKPSYNTTKVFTEYLLATEMGKQRDIWINLSIQDL